MKLSEWKVVANSNISPIERVKEELQKSISDLQTDFPSWKLKNDARFAWFTGVKKVLIITQLRLIFIKDQLSNISWWRKNSPGFLEIDSLLKELDVAIKIELSNLLSVGTEEAFRQIIKSLKGSTSIKHTDSFKNIFEHILRVTKKQNYRNIFDFHRFVRNSTQHSNGIFFPENNKDARVTLFGKKYEFKVGEKIDFITLPLLLKLVEEYNKAIFDIVTSSEIVTIKYVKRFS